MIGLRGILTKFRGKIWRNIKELGTINGQKCDRGKKGNDVEHVKLNLPDEQSCLDIKPLLSICRNLAVPQAAELLCREMQQLADLLTECQKGYQKAEYCLARRKLEEIEAFSKLIGLPVLERVARDVQNCIDVYDSVALSATMSRLLRMGEQSLTAIWDLQDRMH